MIMTLHAHVSIESADCDGRYSRTYIMGATIAHANDWDFKADIIGNVFCTHDSATATFGPDGFSMDAPTDEGYVHTDVTWCEDDDTDTRGTFRDHSAEAAGY